MTTLQSQTINVNGTSIAYRRGGVGQPLLFLHGAGGAGTALAFMEGFTEGHDVTLPDHPGFGASDTPDWLETIHDMAFFYLDFLDALDLRNVHVIGQSLGGWITMEIAVRSTERIDRLSLLGAAGIILPDVAMGDLFAWDKETRYRTIIYDETVAEKLLAMPATPDQDAIAAKNKETTKLLGWDPRFDKGRVEGFEIERAVNVYTPSPCRAEHSGVRPGLHPAKGRFGLVFRVHRICEVDGFVGGQVSHQLLVERNECSLTFN